MKNLVVTDKDISNQLFKNSVIVNLNNINYSSCTGGLECLKCEGACYFKDDMSIISKWMNDCQLIVFSLWILLYNRAIQINKQRKKATWN